MRAYVLYSFDEKARLADVSVPEPGPGQVRVRVLASSINPVDIATANGFFRSMHEYRFPAVQGRDFAGIVDTVGPQVTAYRPGDEVFGMVKRDYIGDGTFAEYVVVDQDRFLVKRPAALDRDAAGALGLAGVTALQCLDALDLQPGDAVFINGATGGVGSFAIQIGRSRGLHVIATARAGEEDRHVRELGAKDTIDWTTSDVAAAVRQLRPEGVRGVIDLVSRDTDSFLHIAGSASPDGTAVTTLSAAPAESTDGPAMVNIHSNSDPALLRRIADLAVEGHVRVPLVKVFSFEHIDEAFALQATAPLGKVGLTVAT
ncbi:NADP-dependent oxidoreductase [Pseudarthrobacter sp. SL88]|uniref:NADP-dependent oxidoreductase n=1 Tax=Pseudarthrobacter sp. SL88 TaxID=2994666 RepID=UPI0022732DE5|nr:NADP-dependent oxidoreductase [Pseudarthrobacter sp. SL88]MCY1674950.1 NADP-dependent oxidoreductase [Pseudarthrobacter sp. SL88]